MSDFNLKRILVAPHPKNPPTEMVVAFYRDEKLPIAFWDAADLKERKITPKALLAALGHAHDLVMNKKGMTGLDFKPTVEAILSGNMEVMYSAVPAAKRRISRVPGFN